MSITPEEFFKKYSKWIIGILLLLFLSSSIKTCNRNMIINVLNSEKTELNDSLNNKYNVDTRILLDSIYRLNNTVQELNFQVKLANGKATAADQRANAVQSTAEKTRSNTTSTIVVKGAEQVGDSTNIKIKK